MKCSKYSDHFWRKTARIFGPSHFYGNCNIIPNSRPFVRLVDPGTFLPTANPVGVATRPEVGAPIPLTVVDITTHKIALDDRNIIFNEYQVVEALLRN